MNKNQKHYIGFWAILFVLFQAIAFISPGWITHEKYTASFWIGYALISVSFVGQLICTMVALKEPNQAKLFYNIPLIRVSYTGLTVSFVAGGMCMLISPLPYWIGGIIAAIVLTVTALSVIKANAAADIVANIDEKIKKDTYFIRNLTMDAEGLVSRAKSPEVKAACVKVYEALRYSDPMSNDALWEVERRLKEAFVAYSDSVKSNAETVSADELLLLIAERNRRCKLLKD